MTLPDDMFDTGARLRELSEALDRTIEPWVVTAMRYERLNRARIDQYGLNSLPMTSFERVTDLLRDVESELGRVWREMEECSLAEIPRRFNFNTYVDANGKTQETPYFTRRRRVGEALNEAEGLLR